MNRIISCTLFLLSASASISQQSGTTEEILRKLEEKGVQGILTGDTVALKQIWAEEFIVTTPRNSIAGSRQAVFSNMKAGLINYKSFDRVIERIQLHDEVAVVMGTETYVPATDLPEANAGTTVRRRFTNIWMKQAGEWKQIARHASIVCS